MKKKIIHSLAFIFTTLLLLVSDSYHSRNFRGPAQLDGEKVSPVKCINIFLEFFSDPGTVTFQIPKDIIQKYSLTPLPFRKERKDSIEGIVKSILKSKPSVYFLNLMKKGGNIEHLKSKTLKEALAPGNLYTFVLKEDGTLIIGNSSQQDLMSNAITKHTLLSNRALKVLFAGEFFLLDGEIIITNGSGSYAPPSSSLTILKEILAEAFGDNPKDIKVQKREDIIEQVKRVKLMSEAYKNKSSMELEAKFSIKSEEQALSIERLVGKQITIIGEQGTPIIYDLRFRSEMLHEDIYFDTRNLDIYHQSGLLRHRTRHWDSEGKSLRDMMFQAKNKSLIETGHSQTIFARQEIRGKTHFSKEMPKRTINSINDKAIVFAKELVKTDDFIPIIESQSNRFYMFAYKFDSSPISSKKPHFMLVIDRVSYYDIRNGKRDFIGEQIEFEIEAIDSFFPFREKSFSSHYRLEKISSLLQNRFDLKASKASKYEKGVNLLSTF